MGTPKKAVNCCIESSGECNRSLSSRTCTWDCAVTVTATKGRGKHDYLKATTGALCKVANVKVTGNLYEYLLLSRASAAYPREEREDVHQLLVVESPVHRLC
jgi:hypothetical protein